MKKFIMNCGKVLYDFANTGIMFFYDANKNF